MHNPSSGLVRLDGQNMQAVDFVQDVPLGGADVVHGLHVLIRDLLHRVLPDPLHVAVHGVVGQHVLQLGLHDFLHFLLVEVFLALHIPGKLEK